MHDFELLCHRDPSAASRNRRNSTSDKHGWARIRSLCPIRVHLCPSVVNILPGNARLLTTAPQRAKDAKRGRVAPAFGFPGLGIGWINLSGELAPAELPRKGTKGSN